MRASSIDMTRGDSSLPFSRAREIRVLLAAARESRKAKNMGWLREPRRHRLISAVADATGNERPPALRFDGRR